LRARSPGTFFRVVALPTFSLRERVGELCESG